MICGKAGAVVSLHLLSSFVIAVPPSLLPAIKTNVMAHTTAFIVYLVDMGCKKRGRLKLGNTTFCSVFTSGRSADINFSQNNFCSL